MLNWQSPSHYEQRMMETLNIIFAGHSKLLHFLFNNESARLRQAAEVLLSGSGGFSSGEQILIRIGLDLWNGSGEATLWQIIETLDDRVYGNVLTGLRHLRQFNPDGPEIRWRQPKMAY